MQRITTFLTFKNNGKAAVEFYVSVFQNSQVDSLTTDPRDGTLLHAAFTLDGQLFMAMEESSSNFAFSQGVSLFVTCATQEEVDYYWEKLGKDGEYLPCGWLKDKFGLSWQVIPTALGELMQDPDPARSQRVMQAMLTMGKIDIAALQRAYDEA